MKRFLLVSVIAIFSALALSAQTTPQTFYVSRTGNNADGKTWATAFSELNQIQWNVVRPGDTIILDGGAVACPPMGDEVPGCGVVFNTPLNFGQSGVTIKLSGESGHNGTAILDGNQTDFTFCSENVNMPTPPRSPGGAVLETGVSFGGVNDSTLDGTKPGGISVRNNWRYGIVMGGGDRNKVRFIKVHHNNDPSDTTNGSVGITTSHTADDITIEGVEVYRNGQDAIRAAADNLTVKDSYIHDHYCNHPDGVQAFVPTSNEGTAEQVISNLVITGNVFERVGLQQIFLGENVTHQSWVNGATIRNNLFLVGKYIIKTKHGNSTNILIENNTFAGSGEFGIEWCCGGSKSPMTIRNNIFHNVRNPAGTGFYLPTVGGNTAFSGNCLTGNTGGRSGNVSESGTVTGDPKFANLSVGDYALLAGSACAGKGSSITSLAMLFPAPVISTATPTPFPTDTATSVPTSTETSTPTPVPTETYAPTETPVPTAYVLVCRVTMRGGIPVSIECP